MARANRRTSRILIIALAVALVLGIVAVLHKPSGSSAAEKYYPPVAISPAPTTNPTIPASYSQAPMFSMPIVLASSNPPPPANDSAPAKVQSTALTNEPPKPQATIPPTANSQTLNLPAANSPAANQLAIAQNPTPLPTIVEGPTTAPSDSSIAGGGSAIDQANADIKIDQLLQARDVLNDALIAGNFSPSDIAPAKALLTQLNQTIIFSPRKFDDDPFGGSIVVQSGQSMGKIARANGMTWQLLSQINNTDPRHLRAGAALKIVKGPFHVVVNKTAFTMDVYLGAPGGRGSMFVRSYPVGLGRDDSTPPGTWMVHSKVMHPTYYSPRGEGVIDADDPKNPVGPCWIGLNGVDGQAVGKLSYGIHGTIDPDSIGKQSSMGCIRMHNEDVLEVFSMLVEGHSIVVVKP